MVQAWDGVGPAPDGWAKSYAKVRRHRRRRDEYSLEVIAGDEARVRGITVAGRLLRSSDIVEEAADWDDSEEEPD